MGKKVTPLAKANLRLSAVPGQLCVIQLGVNSRVVAALLLVSGLAACSIDVPAPKAVVPPPSAPDAGPEALAAWGRVLSTRVDAEGRIDFAGLVRNGADLNAYVAWVAAVSPENEVTLLDPARATKGKELRIGENAKIENVLTWLERR